MNRSKLLMWAAGAVVLPGAAYLASDAWAAVGKVPVLEAKFEAIGQRLERIEDSLDMLLRFQLRHRVETNGTIVVCKDAQGRVAPCEEN